MSECVRVCLLACVCYMCWDAFNHCSAVRSDSLRNYVSKCLCVRSIYLTGNSEIARVCVCVRDHTLII